jgi:class 3 adenylate cyclase
MALLDEATVAAVSGDLGSLATAIIYCNMIATCQGIADIRRASEWTEAAERWCQRQALAGFPGECRIHRAALLRVRGACREAETEARRAFEELRGFRPDLLGSAVYEVGAARLQTWDLAGAEEAFRQAHELGREPEPGLALLRLAQGKTDAAVSAIRSALADEPRDRLARARLLPAHVEIALAAGDLATAGTAADELDAIGESYGTAALRASAACARGALALARGDATAARRSLRRACRLWQELEAPYEVARTRVLLAAACRVDGDPEAARLELEAARTAFERIGAGRDARRAADLLAGDEATEPGAALLATSVARTFMFTDIVKSTQLVEAIGDEAWASLLAWHDQTLRALFAAHGGEEIDHAGDGFFVAFASAPPAVACAVAIQRTLAEHRRTHGFAPQLRIGLHAAPATRAERGYRGRGVHQAARIAAAAEGGQVLASAETVDGQAGLAASGRRALTLKGLDQPVEVVAIEWR